MLNNNDKYNIFNVVMIVIAVLYFVVVMYLCYKFFK